MATPLLARTWGALFLNATGMPSQAAAVLSSITLQPFEAIQQPGLITTYSPWYSADPSGDYEGAVVNPWLEGTAQVAYAWLIALNQTDRWGGLVTRMSALQDSSGGFVYSLVSDSNYQLTTGLSVSATAWTIIAALGEGVFE
jgi:hypothetical protein